MKINFFTNNYKNNRNFSSREQVMYKADTFADEVIDASSSKRLSIENVQEIAKKYLPDIDVKKIPMRSKKYRDLGGVFHSYIVYFTNPERTEIKNRVLELKHPPYSSKNYKEYIATIVHEMTHALQSADEETRDDVLINSCLKELPIEKWEKQVSLAYSAFALLENELLKPAIMAHYDVCDYNDGIDIYDTFINSSKFKTALHNKLEKIKKQNPEIDMNFLKKMLHLQAMDEFDAYYMDEKVKAKLQKSNSSDKDDFIPYLYLVLAKSLEDEME